MTPVSEQGRLYGIGVGPGDPELLTLKARRLIESVDVCQSVFASFFLLDDAGRAAIANRIITSATARFRRRGPDRSYESSLRGRTGIQRSGTSAGRRPVAGASRA